MNTTFSSNAGFFLNSILESLIDGVLITQELDNIIYSNTIAQQLCRKIHPEIENPKAPKSNVTPHIPDEILKLHALMLEDPAQALILESELTIDHQPYRIRVQRIDLETSGENCLLTRIENQAQSHRYQAALESQQYGLTSREAEVWSLRRQDLSRQQIAQKLHVSIDTVKKHLGNIQMKRQSYLDQA
jgi:DNA-binding CsgD family transcriptional regulator